MKRSSFVLTLGLCAALFVVATRKAMATSFS